MAIPVVPPAPVSEPFPLIGYGDVEQTLIEHLGPLLWERNNADVVLGTRYPDTRPGRFVLIRRVGGTLRRTGVDVARVDVQAWDETDVDAHDLAHLIRACVHRARGVGQIRGVAEVASPIPIPDPDSGQPRYLMTFDLTLKGVLL